MTVALAGPADIERILTQARIIAVLGIKPESRAERAAFWIPERLQQLGYRVHPVPARYPTVTHILGEPVFRTVAEIPVTVDIVNVFRRPERCAAHLDDLLAARPRVVWFQSGCLEMEVARALVAADIEVVHGCIACEHALLAGRKPSAPAQLI